MNKFVDFYNKVIADESSKKELSSILSGKTLNDASDEQLEKVGQIAKRLGFDITTSEAREFLNSGDKKLSSEDLDAVAGGKPQGSFIKKEPPLPTGN
jgi:hypothetical protein